MKKRVTGLSGVFFKSRDPEAIKSWYNKHLQLEAGEYGAMFNWIQADNPGKKEFMFYYRVENLVELLKVQKEEGWEPLDKGTL